MRKSILKLASDGRRDELRWLFLRQHSRRKMPKKQPKARSPYRAALPSFPIIVSAACRFPTRILRSSLTITVSHESGFYVGAGVRTSSENAGDDIEVDLYAGFAGGDELTYDIGATYYLYPGVSSFNYVELTGKLGSTIGPATVGVQLKLCAKPGQYRQ